jgi:hypothetical protein
LDSEIAIATRDKVTQSGVLKLREKRMNTAKITAHSLKRPSKLRAVKAWSDDREDDDGSAARAANI